MVTRKYVLVNRTSTAYQDIKDGGTRRDRRVSSEQWPGLTTRDTGARAIATRRPLHDQNRRGDRRLNAGATHVAYTSMPRPEPGSPFLIASDHYGTEQAMKASGLAYTIFRPNSYHENLLTSLPRIIETGRWLTSAGDGRVAYAARDDIAAAIAGRLASDSTETAIIELTGPKAYSNAEVAELVSDVTGRSLEVVPVSDEALNEALQTAGVPEAFARLWVSVNVYVRAGNSELVTDTIEKLSRRKPTPLTQFLETHRSALLR